ncbi:hypothetical protein AHF37_11134 [Paragonimus kellicotti]|nr:hypothetical protein AHF37_11134 [Paragonimus kellicotti]
MYFLQTWSTLVTLICILCLNEVACVMKVLAVEKPLTGEADDRHCPTRRDTERLRKALTSGNSSTLDLSCVHYSNYTILDVTSQVRDKVMYYYRIQLHTSFCYEVTVNKQSGSETYILHVRSVECPEDVVVCETTV